MTGPRVGVAVPAAGAGRRMGGTRKPFLVLGGRPLLLWALRPFLELPEVTAVAVALGAADAADPPAWLRGHDPRIRVVEGGEERTDSVRAAVAALPADVDVIAVHDAARPFVTADAVRRCIDVARAGQGAVAGCPAVDTIKEVDGARRVLSTPDRARLWHAHTPQVFPAALLRAAYTRPGAAGTDDAALVEAAGGEVVMIDAGPHNLKITRPADLPLAEAILAAREGVR